MTRLRDFVDTIIKNSPPSFSSVDALAHWIYISCFIVQPTPCKKTLFQNDTDFQDSLNAALEFPDAWVKLSDAVCSDDIVSGSYTGLNIKAQVGQWRNDGIAIETKIPRYISGNDQWIRYSGGDLQIRPQFTGKLYFMITPPGAVRFLKFCNQIVQDNNLVFDLKVASSLELYQKRSDVCMLYFVSTQKNALPKFLEPIIEQLDASGELVHGDVPLTYIIQQGVYYADIPSDSNSFGMHRCKLIASALLGVAPGESTEECYEKVEQVFREKSYSPDMPWKNSA